MKTKKVGMLMKIINNLMIMAVVLAIVAVPLNAGVIEFNENSTVNGTIVENGVVYNIILEQTVTLRNGTQYKIITVENSGKLNEVLPVFANLTEEKNEIITGMSILSNRIDGLKETAGNLSSEKTVLLSEITLLENNLSAVQEDRENAAVAIEGNVVLSPLNFWIIAILVAIILVIGFVAMPYTKKTGENKDTETKKEVLGSENKEQTKKENKEDEEKKE